MGNGDSKGKGHWTDSPNVLHEAERIRTQPTTRSVQQPPQNPVTVDATPTHVAVNTGSVERPLGGGFYGRVDGPNGELGARRTESGGFRAGAQANLGGVAVGHKNQNHDVSAGVGVGRGPGGIEVHGGEMPGVTASIGPFTGSMRSTALAQPVDPQTENAMKFLGRR